MAVQPNAQEVLKQFNPANKSAHVKQAVDMLTNLKKSNGNPKGVNAVGPQQLAGMLKGFFDKFIKNKKPKNKKDEQELAKILLETEAKLKAIEQQAIVNQQYNVGS